MNRTAPSAVAEWRGNWGIVLAGVVGMSFVAMPSTALGLFMEPLEREFGWSRAEISFGMTIFAIVSTPLAPAAGALADRFGSRAVAIPGTILCSLAVAAFALISGAYWQYLALWVFYALAQLLIRSFVWTRAAAASFHLSLGLALAVMMGGVPLAQTAAPILAEWLIADHGWRFAFAALGLGWGGVLLAVTALCFREAGDKPRPDPRSAAIPMPAALGLSFGEALRDPRMWRIIVAIVLQSFIAGSVALHIFPLVTAAGLDREAAAGIVALLGVSALGGQFATGILADRVASTFLPVTCFVLPALAMVLLLAGGGSLPLLALGVILAGFSASSCMTMTTYMTSRYAGTAHFGKIFGIISSGMGLGAGVGPVVAGRIFDTTGSYDGFLMIGIGLALVNAVLVFRLGAYPDFTQRHTRLAGA